MFTATIMDIHAALYADHFKGNRASPPILLSGLRKHLQCHCHRPETETWCWLPIHLPDPPVLVAKDRVHRLALHDLEEVPPEKSIRFHVTDFGFHTEAMAGNTLMSLIHSAELNGIEPFEYLIELLKLPEDVEWEPARWMPWRYPAPAGFA